MEYEPFGARLARFRRLLEDKDLDACLIAGPENRYYLSGYAAEDLLLTETSGYLFIGGESQFLLTDFRYEEQAKQDLGTTLTQLKTAMAELEPWVLAKQQVRLSVLNYVDGSRPAWQDVVTGHSETIRKSLIR